MSDKDIYLSPEKYRLPNSPIVQALRTELNPETTVRPEGFVGSTEVTLPPGGTFARDEDGNFLVDTDGGPVYIPPPLEYGMDENEVALMKLSGLLGTAFGGGTEITDEVLSRQIQPIPIESQDFLKETKPTSVAKPKAFPKPKALLLMAMACLPEMEKAAIISLYDGAIIQYVKEDRIPEIADLARTFKPYIDDTDFLQIIPKIIDFFKRYKTLIPQLEVFFKKLTSFYQYSFGAIMAETIEEAECIEPEALVEAYETLFPEMNFYGMDYVFKAAFREYAVADKIDLIERLITALKPHDIRGQTEGFIVGTYRDLLKEDENSLVAKKLEQFISVEILRSIENTKAILATVEATAFATLTVELQTLGFFGQAEVTGAEIHFSGCFSNTPLPKGMKEQVTTDMVTLYWDPKAKSMRIVHGKEERKEENIEMGQIVPPVREFLEQQKLFKTQE